MRRVWLVAVLCALSSGVAGAETLLLIPGYLGSSDSWRSSGVTESLEAAGWQDGGRLTLVWSGVRASRPPPPGERRFYTLELETEAPLQFQADQLAAYMRFVQRLFPDSPVILAGHSAGGVVARLYMVEHPQAGVAGLITIASPHLGTESAEWGAAAGNSPLGWFAPLVGGAVLTRSQGLFRDLARERPGNLLWWLNRQPHPDATYVSVVRSGGHDPLGLGEVLVPVWSQDMNRVPALRGRVRTIAVKGGHGLSPEDGALLVKILNHLRRTGFAPPSPGRSATPEAEAWRPASADRT